MFTPKGPGQSGACSALNSTPGRTARSSGRGRGAAELKARQECARSPELPHGRHAGGDRPFSGRLPATAGLGDRGHWPCHDAGRRRRDARHRTRGRVGGRNQAQAPVRDRVGRLHRAGLRVDLGVAGFLGDRRVSDRHRHRWSRQLSRSHRHHAPHRSTEGVQSPKRAQSSVQPCRQRSGGGAVGVPRMEIRLRRHLLAGGGVRCGFYLFGAADPTPVDL
jgi:hypothetical protein